MFPLIVIGLFIFIALLLVFAFNQAQRQSSPPLTPDTEGEAIAAIEQHLRETIDRDRATTSNGLAQRDVHPKHHGCVWAEFIVEELPENLQVGMFAQPKTYPAWIRLSNATTRDDRKRDLKGMAIKVMDMPEPTNSFLPEEADGRTQDFLFTSHPVFFVGNFADSYWHYTSRTPILLRVLLAGRWRQLGILLAMLLKQPVVSAFETPYWSMTTYKFGANHPPVKYLMVPSANNSSQLKRGRSQNFLRERMEEYLTVQHREACFDFYIEIQGNPAEMPVDDATVEWKNAQRYKLATLKIPPQRFNTTAQMAFGEHLAYSPWHTLPDHEPLGGVNMVRRLVYHHMSRYRRSLNKVEDIVGEPTPASRQPDLLSYSQNPLTVIIPIQPTQETALRTLLQHHSDEIQTAFQSSPLTHFARFVILKDASQDMAHPHLLFSCTFDGGWTAYIGELCANMADWLDKIFSHCQDYEPGSALQFTPLQSFLQRHSQTSQVFFMAYWDVTASAIRQTQQYCHDFNQHLNNPTFKAQWETVFQDVCPTVPNATLPPPSASSSALENQLEALLEKYWVGIRPAQNDPSYHLQPTPEQRQRIQESRDVEDRMAQNQLLIYVAIEPGWLKLNLRILKLILRLADRRAKQARGSLSGIPTIHSLRWGIINPGAIRGSERYYLLFESNYNGSWDSYIDDFVDYAYRRMNLIWGKCIQYSSRGSKDIEWFKRHIRNYQFPAQVYYSAYPELTVRNILTNLAVNDAVTQLEHFAKGSYHTIR